MLNQSHKQRYLRAINLPNVGEEGQLKLLGASVLIVGVGAIGSITSTYLTAAGVGRIGLIDFDTIDIEDLQHQVLYETSFLNRPKVRSAQAKLQRMNPDIVIEGYFQALDVRNALKIIQGYDFIIDTTSNLHTTFLVNQACVATNKPFSTAGYYQYQGQIMTHIPGSACFSCVFESLLPQELRRTIQSGVYGFSTGIVGSMQAGEAIKYFLHKDTPYLRDTLLVDCLGVFDTQNLYFNKLLARKNPSCPVCSKDSKQS